MRAFNLIFVTLLFASLCLAQNPPRRLKRQVETQYPELAKRMNASGSVRLKLFVSKDGKVKQVVALRVIHLHYRCGLARR